ncbi:MAG: CAP domain-containing protein [Actinomycetota bacterium]
MRLTRQGSIRKILTAMLLGAAIAGALSLPSAATATTVESASSSGDNTCWNYKTSERSFAKKNNAARAAIALGKLSLDPELSRVAIKHTQEMIKAASGEIGGDDLFHSTATQLRNRVTGDWTLLGENVGVGGTVSSLHEAFMNSPLHRANMLNPTFKHIGVGVIKKDNRIWVTVMFSAGGDPGTSLRMPRC